MPLPAKPTVNGSPNVWGGVLNTYLDSVTPKVDGKYIKNSGGSLVEGVIEDDVAATAAVQANTAAVARVAPAVVGGNRQFVVIIDGQPTWFDDTVFNVKWFKAKGDGTTDDTTAVANAIAAAKAVGGTVYFPVGTYLVSGLTVDAMGVTFRGAGRVGSILLTVSGDLLTMTGAHQFTAEHLWFRSATGGGHVFRVTNSLSQGIWSNIQVYQDNDAKSILQADDGGAATINYIDNLWEHCYLQHTLTNTVPTMNLRGVAINSNRWSSIRAQKSATHTWLIETTAGGSYAENNEFHRINGETLNGGFLKLLGARNTLLLNVGLYDLNTTTKDLIYLGNSSVSPTLATANTTLVAVKRIGGTLGAGLYDLKEATTVSSPATRLINCGSTTPFAWDAGNHRGTYEGGSVVLTNGSVVTQLSANGTVTIPGQVRAGSLGVGNAVAATTPASVVKKIEVFDVNGVSLGFVPVYNSIS